MENNRWMDRKEERKDRKDRKKVEAEDDTPRESKYVCEVREKVTSTERRGGER